MIDQAGHLLGAPDLVIDLLSAGTDNEKRDRELKLKLYSSQGVLEYWTRIGGQSKFRFIGAKMAFSN